jgi:biotin synthase-related radical SAM superfamily protein
VSHKLPAIDKRASNTVLKQKIKDISKDEANVSKGKVALLHTSDSTNRGFYSMMNDVKKRDLEFQIEKHEDDKELKREELEYKRRKVDTASSSSRKDIIETLIKQGKSPEEIKAYMEVITTFL